MGKTRNAGKDNPFYGRHHSAEQRKRWSEQRKGHGASRHPYIPKNLTKDMLTELYTKRKLPRTRISQITGYSDWTIAKALELFGIPARNRSEIISVNNSLRPRKDRLLTKEGYIYIYKPEHHRANNNGYLWEHIWIWEQVNRRVLPDGWVIHHINGIKNDNRFENLMALPRKSHHGNLIIQAMKKRIRSLEAENKRLKSQTLMEVNNAS